MGPDRGKMAHKWLLPAIAVAVIVADQLTKSWIREIMRPGESVPLVANLSLTYVQNTGSAFGLFAGRGFILSIFGLVSVLLILLFYRRLSSFGIVALTALSLVLGGAVGNLIDRFALGYVTDFIDVRVWGDFHWPYFNVADSAITVGGVMLVYYLLGLLKREDRDGVCKHT